MCQLHEPTCTCIRSPLKIERLFLKIKKAPPRNQETKKEHDRAPLSFSVTYDESLISVPPKLIYESLISSIANCMIFYPPLLSLQATEREREMMESLKEEVKLFCCKVCEKSFSSGPALGGHMRSHFSGDLSRKTKSGFGKLEKEVALALVKLKMSGSMKSELLEIDISKSGAQEAASKSLSVEIMDPAPKEDKIVPSAKKRKMAHTDFSLPDLKRVKYECNTCHRAFRSQQALGGHRSGRTRGRTCKQEEIESKPFAARFNLDGYILTSNVVWAKRRRSARVFVSYFVKN